MRDGLPRTGLSLAILVEGSADKFGNPEQALGLAHPQLQRHVYPIARRMAMAWKTPRIVEIAVGMEINSYACAAL